MDVTLLIFGCSIFAILGFGHAVLMLFTTKFEPRDHELFEKLKIGKTSMSKTGNMWNGIKGFHISHSLGLIIYGGFYIVLALENNSYLKSSAALNVGLFGVAITYIFLAHRFWFSVPRNCFIVAICFLAMSVVFR
ncbi:MAG: hypothetical protein A3I66_18930 [Burkholderiales bacterium RIFCSPLOWO2_02_FULL_57_36]|nr:MAG: hypothetical protein A3I66_18930 [Burkholderiales bacterium RIFCSPLOWO2_02_FULL_57_36]